MLRWIINEGYGDALTLERRARKMAQWLAKPELMQADAEYVEMLEIDLAKIKDLILCCPNDPNDAKTLSDVSGEKLMKSLLVLV